MRWRTLLAVVAALAWTGPARADATDRALDEMIRETEPPKDSGPVVAPDAQPGTQGSIGGRLRRSVERSLRERRERTRERCRNCGGPAHPGACPPGRDPEGDEDPVPITPWIPIGQPTFAPPPGPPAAPDGGSPPASPLPGPLASPESPPAPASPPLTPSTPHSPPPAGATDDAGCGVGLDIHPVQVVQDPPHEAPSESIPLVEGKSTMVRVFVLLPDPDRCPLGKGMDGATCVLLWQGVPLAITADVVRGRGRSWVLERDPAPPGGGKSHHDKIIDHLNGVKQAADNVLKEDKYWAFNFLIPANVRRCPPSLSLTAFLIYQGKLVARRTESSGSEFKIRKYVGSYDPGVFNMVVGAFASVRIADEFIPRALAGTAGIKNNAAAVEATAHYRQLLAQKADQYRHEILAVYPVPDASVTTTIVTTMYTIPATFGSGYAAADTYAGPFSKSTAIEKEYPKADAILLVTNPRESTNETDQFETGGEVGYCKCAGWTPFFSKSIHYITCKTSASTLVAAHEIGHDSRFHGAGHTGATPTPDGWDAGDNLGLTTTRGRHALMKAVAENPWVLPGEYRRHLNALCGGSDPALVNLRGLLEADGKLAIGDPWMTEGIAPPRRGGPGSLVFTDARGKKLATARFALEEARGRRGFHVTAPVPGGARMMTLALPRGVKRTFPISKDPPEFAWRSIATTADGNGLKVSFTASHPERQAVALHFIYSPDGRRFLDLAPPASAVAAGEVVLPLRDLPGGKAARLTAWIWAGLRLTVSTSSPFAVPDRAPWLWVGEDAGAAGAARFGVTVYDPEDGFELTPEWTADGGTPLGRGAHPDDARLAALAPGPHRLSATVVDSSGQRVTASLSMTR